MPVFLGRRHQNPTKLGLALLEPHHAGFGASRAPNYVWRLKNPTKLCLAPQNPSKLCSAPLGPCYAVWHAKYPHLIAFNTTRTPSH